MNILFAASENSWGGFFDKLRRELPHHNLKATGKFQIDNLKGIVKVVPDNIRRLEKNQAPLYFK